MKKHRNLGWIIFLAIVAGAAVAANFTIVRGWVATGANWIGDHINPANDTSQVEESSTEDSSIETSSAAIQLVTE